MRTTQNVDRWRPINARRGLHRSTSVGLRVAVHMVRCADPASPLASPSALILPDSAIRTPFRPPALSRYFNSRRERKIFFSNRESGKKLLNTYTLHDHVQSNDSCVQDIRFCRITHFDLTEPGCLPHSARLLLARTRGATSRDPCSDSGVSNSIQCSI